MPEGTEVLDAARDAHDVDVRQLGNREIIGSVETVASGAPSRGLGSS